MNIPFSPPDITEDDITAVANTLRSGWITTGPECKMFEKELSLPWMSGYRVAVLNSATAAMEIVLRILGIGFGDEVITSVYTYAATVNVIRHVGATPVLVDVIEGGYNLSHLAVERAITSRTKVIIPVDIGGYPCDYAALYDVVESKKDLFTGLPRSRLFHHADRVVILADAAHSLGARIGEAMSGSLADFSAFSFHAVKNLTTAEGGALSFTHLFGVSTEDIYREVMLWSLHGQDKDALTKAAKGSWEYDVLFSGYKCNMTDIAAALGRSQLRRYHQTLEQRRKIYANYRLALPSPLLIAPWDVDDTYHSSFHLAIMQIPGISEEGRNQFIRTMAMSGVACNVHFKPIILLQAFVDLGYQQLDFPQAFNRYKESISLPIYTQMQKQEQEYVIDKLCENYKNYS
ncbi:DegT/DnrJ/EryC1/StrS family aminotransferase [Entomospira nematocerorum]|uniref:DegT/DnrJ/EryC1/StrS family aminotransferase n=1 Tax=Entomospira nematocerorum TaxID=2719987 RepID=A0A968KXY3_9SPIO|nr:DegT/DnrJ/EryC1/StrS family aminotransferase [Entomospira nematocera]NIZ46997.1 DegT/DnrJ/EryC1/StrS family aminotransferase [Entomospira nematocera]WDI34459.1 DegT/DnrJ/EryC1/StrS family aminotransferase [Entomospira nematocera]